jgi:hypothetical protein
MIKNQPSRPDRGSGFKTRDLKIRHSRPLNTTKQSGQALKARWVASVGHTVNQQCKLQLST